VVFRCLEVECDCLLLNVGVAHDDHDVSRGGEFVDEGCELLVADDHRLEAEVSLNARELELLDNVADLLKAMDILVLLGIMVRDHQEGRALEQDYFIGIQGFAELA